MRKFGDPPSRRRFAPITPIEKDQDGRLLCRNCGDPLPKRRRAYCCEPCHWEYMAKHSPTFAGLLFRHRYGTRCAGCGADEQVLKDEWLKEICALVDAGKPLRDFKSFALDHIRPVADGGGSCGLENYRLLCPACHTKITATFNRERAARKRETGPWKAIAREQSGYRVPLPERP